MLAEIRKCAEANDIKGLRYIFVDCLDVDPTFEKYREDYNYCKNIPGMFDAHAGLSGIIMNEQAWTSQYWNQLKLDLMKNFSEERFEHMIQVAKVVYADKTARLMSERRLAGKKRALEEENRGIKAGEGVKRAEDRKTEGARDTAVTEKPHIRKPDVSPAEMQERRLAEKRRALEEENRRIQAQEAAEKARRAADRKFSNREASDRVYAQSRNSEPKKALGIVLGIIVIAIVVFIIVNV